MFCLAADQCLSQAVLIAATAKQAFTSVCLSLWALLGSLFS